MIAAHEFLHSWLAGNADSLRDHVLLSTAVLLVLLAVSMLPTLRPRTRYALMLLGVGKFFVPAAALSGLVATVSSHQLALPSFSVSAVFSAAAPSPRSESLCLLGAVWLAGSVLLVMRMVVLQCRWSRAVHRSQAASPREIAAMRSIAGGSPLRTPPRVVRSAAAIPLTAGFVRPVVMLPESCAAALADDELKAVLAHELAHVERRHNLAALVQNAALALFWFDPALWLATIRLDAEAEKDCDERVLSFVPDPPTYLSGMLKVSYGFIAPQPAGVSCMSTSLLKERMNHLMKHYETQTHSVPHRLAVAAGIAAVVLTTVFVSAGESPKAEQKGDTTMPKLVTKVNPIYPEAARKSRLQGIVVVETTIDTKGNVTSAKIAKGVEGEEGKALEDAAVVAVKQWKFEPAQKKGKAVAVTYKVTVRFKLDK